MDCWGHRTCLGLSSPDSESLESVLEEVAEDEAELAAALGGDASPGSFSATGAPAHKTTRSLRCMNEVEEMIKYQKAVWVSVMR